MERDAMELASKIVLGWNIGNSPEAIGGATAWGNGMLPFYRNNGYTGMHGFGIFDRDNNTVFDQQALDGLPEGSL